MTYSHAKVEGQQSVGSEDRAETNRWMDRKQTEVIALPPTLMWLVIICCHIISKKGTR